MIFSPSQKLLTWLRFCLVKVLIVLQALMARPSLADEVTIPEVTFYRTGKVIELVHDTKQSGDATTLPLDAVMSGVWVPGVWVATSVQGGGEQNLSSSLGIGLGIALLVGVVSRFVVDSLGPWHEYYAPYDHVTDENSLTENETSCAQHLFSTAIDIGHGSSLKDQLDRLGIDQLILTVLTVSQKEFPRIKRSANEFQIKRPNLWFRRAHYRDIPIRTVLKEGKLLDLVAYSWGNDCEYPKPVDVDYLLR